MIFVRLYDLSIGLKGFWRQWQHRYDNFVLDQWLSNNSNYLCRHHLERSTGFSNLLDSMSVFCPTHNTKSLHPAIWIYRKLDMRERPALNVVQVEIMLSMRPQLYSRQDQHPFVVLVSSRIDVVWDIRGMDFTAFWKIALEMRRINFDMIQKARCTTLWPMSLTNGLNMLLTVSQQPNLYVLFHDFA